VKSISWNKNRTIIVNQIESTLSFGGKMKKIVLIGFSVLVILALVSACAPSVIPTAPMTIAPSTVKPDTQPDVTMQVSPAETSPVRTVSVTGNGQVYLVPDVAYVYIGVHSQSENVTEALNQNNDQAKAVTDALIQLGIAEKDIQTTSFNIYPQQNYEPNTGKVTGTTYMIDNSVYVTVRELKRLGDMLDVVVRSGANSINGINFDVVDKESARSEARTMAIDNARKQAEELAKASGVSVGDVLMINTSTMASQYNPKEIYGIGGGGGMAAAPNSTPISQGQLLLSVDVTMTFEIK